MNERSDISARELAERAKAAQRKLALLSSEKRSELVTRIGEAIRSERRQILEANFRDTKAAEAAGLSEALLDRLRLDDERIDSMADGLAAVSELPDPLGEVLREYDHPQGMRIESVRVPIGVVLMIYEARPNVSADAAGLCLKSGNAVILRGGKEARLSNLAIVQAMSSAALRIGAPPHCMQFVENQERSYLNELLRLSGIIDLVIPRGGEGLIRAVAEHSRIPVIKHYKGVCHVYVDRSADLERASAIVENAKCQRPGVCNAMETLLVDREIADAFLPKICERLRGAGVELRGDTAARRIVPEMHEAGEDDWSAEYLDLILSIRIVDDCAAAIEHINKYGSGHSDAIVAEDDSAAGRFLAAVDSAAVYHNASTRFTDGAEFGLGAEIGISTDKLHARGPMGIEGLTSYKYVVRGSGQIRG